MDGKSMRKGDQLKRNQNFVKVIKKISCDVEKLRDNYLKKE